MCVRVEEEAGVHTVSSACYVSPQSVPPSVILTCADVGGVGGVAAVVLLLQEVLEDLATVQSIIAGFPVGTVRATC